MARPRKIATTETGTTGDTVVVGCKLPQGLHIVAPELGIDLKLHGMHSVYAVAGYGITRGVDASMWAKIEQRFAHAKWLTSQAVFVVGDPQSAADRATEQKKINVGFDSIDPRELSRATGGRIQTDGDPDTGPR